MKKKETIEHELWVRWQPIENFVGGYSVRAVLDSVAWCDFRLLLVPAFNGGRGVISFDFSDSVSAHRQTDRRIADGFLGAAREQHGQNIFTECPFFKVINSRYVQDFVDESYGFVTQDWFTHYVFVGEDFVVDVAACEEPVVEISGRARQADEDETL